MKKLKILLAIAACCLMVGGCGEKTQNPNNKEPKEYSYSELEESKDKFWDLWVTETGKLSEVEYYGTSEDEEGQSEHYLKVATEIANRIAKENKDIPVGERVVVAGYIEDVAERDGSGFFTRHGDGKIRFCLKHNAKDNEYDGFLCTTNEEEILELENNTPVKIEATFLKPDIIGSDNDLYDCKIIEKGQLEEVETESFMTAAPQFD